MLGHKRSFPNSRFRDSGRLEITQAHHDFTAKPATANPKFVYITVILS